MKTTNKKTGAFADNYSGGGYHTCNADFYVEICGSTVLSVQRNNHDLGYGSGVCEI